jgi:response regulator RpfG family c-di-GMP phosphodiesterase
MDTANEFRFIIIDDDHVINLISRRTLVSVFPNAETIAFSDVEEAIEKIQKDKSLKKTILFLDIDMPKMNGWDFLDKFNEFSESIKSRFQIFLYSGVADLPERDKANNHPLVIDVIDKPFTAEYLKGRFYFIGK